MENGAPVEGYAYSNNVVRRAAPGFDGTAFDLEQAHTLQPTKMIYLN